MDEEFRWNAGRERPPRRRVMVGLALPVVGGTAAGLAAPFPAMWFWGAGALLLLPLFLWVRRGWSSVPLMLALFCLVAAHARMTTGGGAAVPLDRQLAGPVEYVQFVAVVQEDAVLRPSRPGQAASAVFPARMEGLNRDGDWRRVDEEIRVVLRGWPAGDAIPRYGERWRFRGVVRPSVPRRSGLLRLSEHQAVVDPDRAVRIEAGQGHPLKAWCLQRRRAARGILARGLADYPEESGLLQALLLGYREDLPELLRRDFAVTGTVHIFAISGAHVGIVTLLLAGLLRSLGVPQTRWCIYLAPLLAIYTVATGAATSAVRASLMATLLLAAPLMRRQPDAISTLAVAAGAILLAAPAQLGDLGFLLSFTAVGGLLALQPVFDAWALKIFRREDWQLDGEERPVRRCWREGGLAVTRFGLVSVSAWISTSPLTAYFFNLVSPVALAMNLVVIPAAFAILLAGVLSLTVAPFSGEASEIFNHAARVFAQGLAALIRGAAAVPGGHGFVRTPPAAGVVLWYALLGGTAILARRTGGALWRGLALLAALALAWGVWEARRCRVSVLEVGEGHAVLVQAESARLLVDCGSAHQAEGTLRRLRQAGVNRIDALVLTHADADHVGGARFLMSEVPVGELWVPGRVWPSPRMREILTDAEARGIPVRRRQSGDQGDWPGHMYWEVLWPPPDVSMARADDASLVMRVARYGVSILLMADAGEGEEAAMIRGGASLAGSVLLAGRHGDARATSGEWLDAVRPREGIISSGPHADGRHPDDEVLRRLDARGIRTWRTDRQGTIHVDLEGAPARWPGTGYRIRAEP